MKQRFKQLPRRHIALLVLLVLLLTVLSSGCENTSQASLPPEAAGRTVITMGVLTADENSTCHRIANAFNAAQDEVWLEIKTYVEDTSVKDADMWRQHMYSELASGNYSDLYEMKSINAQALRDAGYLADWYPLMEADPDFHMVDYFSNIWSQLETDGKLYQMAIDFHIHGMYLPKEDYTGQDGWTLAEYTAYMDSHRYTARCSLFLRAMLDYGCHFEFVDLAQNTCHFEDPAFFEILSYLQTLPAEGGEGFRRGRIQGADQHEGIYRREGVYPRIVGLPTQNRTGPAVTINNCYGLSSETEHPEACWALIRWLLAYEQQLMPIEAGVNPVLTDSIPMLRDAWERQLYCAGLDGHHEDSLFYRHSYGDKVYPEAIYPAMPQEELDYLRDLVANADYVSLAYFDYEDITAIVEEEVLVFLAGDRTAEECARIIQSRVSTFLAERS